MMLCSVELPIKYLELSNDFDFDFVIASTCVEYPEYFEYFLYRRKSRFTILDNGAFETGEALPDKMYIDIAEKLQPEVLIIPDVYKNMHKTMLRFNFFMKKNPLQNLPNTDLMGVLQAQGSVDNAEMLANLYNAQNIKWFGIPYAAGLDRYQLIKKHPEWENIHILGLPHLSEAIALVDLSNVKSIDSSLPVKAAMENKILIENMNASVYASPNEKKIKSYLLRENLRQFKRFCNGQVHYLFGGQCK